MAFLQKSLGPIPAKMSGTESFRLSRVERQPHVCAKRKQHSPNNTFVLNQEDGNDLAYWLTNPINSVIAASKKPET
ncbi:hypothetical protein YC2023_056595 [Brassica napus]